MSQSDYLHGGQSFVKYHLGALTGWGGRPGGEVEGAQVEEKGGDGGHDDQVVSNLAAVLPPGRLADFYNIQEEE